MLSKKEKSKRNVQCSHLSIIASIGGLDTLLAIYMASVQTCYFHNHFYIFIYWLSIIIIFIYFILTIYVLEYHNKGYDWRQKYTNFSIHKERIRLIIFCISWKIWYCGIWWMYSISHIALSLIHILTLPTIYSV